MSLAVLEVVSPGLGASFQDRGRWQWRRYGVPASGAMDHHAAEWANRLLDNRAGTPIVELLLQGARFRALQPVWVAITGADASANVPCWRAVQLAANDLLEFPHNKAGVWIYLAVESGFKTPRILGSASVYARGHLGRPLVAGDLLHKTSERPFQLPPGIGGRSISWSERRDYAAPPALRVWPGPQADSFIAGDRHRFFDTSWTVSPRSDRVGYRLSGPALKPITAEIISEPVRVGSVQVPDDGAPIIIMRDGPTVGGYPKIGMVDPADLCWLAQCRPGQGIRFTDQTIG